MKPKKLSFFSEKKITVSSSVIISIVVLAILITGIVKAVSKIDFTVFLKIAGDELLSDAYGHTNFLVLGTGGKNHEGSDLTDTIILASLDKETKKMAMISIPRDLYIQDDIVGNSKINEVYFYANKYFDDSQEGLDHLKTKVEQLMGVPIHYWVKIDFDGFKELVDALGGIDLYVEEAIYDPFYPKDGTYLFEPFSITAGQHHLDGETALKYARSRKTTSDFDRARRQQQIIYAIKEKALQMEVLLDQSKISDLLDALKSNIETNITVKEILTLGAMAKDYSEDQISHRLIHDDPWQCGGFLYTPERIYYGGAFVLIPAGGLDYLHWYTDLNLNSQYISPENTKIHILNGTPLPGIAGENKGLLTRYCFNVNRYGNGRSQEITKTTYFYSQKKNEKGEDLPSRPPALDFLQKIIPGEESTVIPLEYQEYMTGTDIILEIGTDYTGSDKYVEDPFLTLPVPKIETETTTETDGTSETATETDPALPNAPTDAIE